MSITTTQTVLESNTQTSNNSNPFLGLRAFGPEDHHLFFGREEQSMELLRRLRLTRFLAISGQSGSGKSSLVSSGLVPTLMKGFVAQAGSQWRIATFEPGNNPMHNLAQAIAKRKVLHSNSKMEPNYPEHVEAILRRSSLGLVDAYKESKIRDNLLVVVDQFEELFKYHEMEKASQTAQTDAIAFVNSLLVATNQRDYPIYIVVTMRSDFFGDATEFRGLAESINKGQYLTPRMKREEIRKAITGPIAYAGASITPRLRSRLLNDVGEDADQLPLLQHAMMRMWDNWFGKTDETKLAEKPIDLRHYEAIGGMENALNMHLEEAYGELETTHEREICEKLFKALTDTSSDGRGVRRTVTLEEICQVVEASEEEVLSVMSSFRQKGRHFLVPEEGVLIEKNTPIGISHEVMMRKWKRLIQWVEEEQHSADIYRRLAEAANLYITGQSALWRDPELQIAVNWYEEDEPNAAWARRYNPNFEEAIDFLNKSKEQANFEIAQIEARRKRELENSKRFNRIVGIAGLIAILLSLMSWYFYGEAQDQSKMAIAEQARAEEEAENAQVAANLARQASAKATEEQKRAEIEAERAEEQQQKAILAAKRAEANEQKAKEKEQEANKEKKRAEASAEEARMEKSNALKAKEKALTAQRNAELQRSRAEGLQKLSQASALAFKAIRVEDEKSRVKALLAAEAYHVYYNNPLALDYNADIYSGLYYGVRALHGVNFNTIHDKHFGAVRSIRFNQSGRKFYTTGSDGSLLGWNVKSWNGAKKPKVEINTITSQREVMNNLAISNNNKWLAVGGKIPTIEVYDVKNTAAPPKLVNIHNGKEVLFIEFLSDNQTFVSAGKDNTIRTYNLQSGKTAVLDSTKSPVTALAVGANGQKVVWGTSNGKITYWNLQSKQKKLLGSEGANITSLGINPAGNMMVVGLKQTGSVEIWEKPTSNEDTFTLTLALEQHIAHVNDIAFSLDGTKLATASYDGTVRVWLINQLKADYQPINLDDHDSWAMSVDFSKDGEYVVVGTRLGELRFWNLELNELRNEICAKVEKGLSVKEQDLYLGNDFIYQDPCQ